MRRGIAARLSAGLACGSCLLLPLAPASATTTVTVEGTTVVVHVPIQIAAPPGQMLTEAAARSIERDVERIWNDAFKGFRWKCLSFRLDLQLIPVGSRRDWSSGHHFIQIDPNANSSWWNPTGSDDRNPTLDNPFPYSREMDGVWATPDPSVIAHEIGHAVGLGDDYYTTCTDPKDASTCRTTGRKPSGEMIEGADIPALRPTPDTPGTGLGGTFTTAGWGAPDPAALARVVEQIKAAGKLPRCWSGTFRTTTTRTYVTNVGTFRCTDGWQGTIEFVQKQDGGLDGAATAKLSSPARCDLPSRPPGEIQAYDLKVGGAGTQQGFSLRLSIAGWRPPGFHVGTLGGFPSLHTTDGCRGGGPPELSIPKVGPDRAEATIDKSGQILCAGSANDTLSSHTVLELRERK